MKLELNNFYKDRISYCILNNPHFLLFDFYKRLPFIVEQEVTFNVEQEVTFYRRTKNLKEFLAPSKFQVTACRNQREENGGCSKCNKKCDLCKNYLIQASKFQSSATGPHYSIQQKLSCSAQNVIYLATCAKCNLQYVGSTSTEFKVRFRNHKSNMRKNKRTCELATTIITLNMKFHKSISSLSNKLGLLKILYILNNCYSLGRPIGLRNYLPLILVVLIKGGNLDRNTALITTIE